MNNQNPLKFEYLCSFKKRLELLPNITFHNM